MDGWTIADAAANLDPPMTEDEVRAMVKLLGLDSVGKRRSGRRGRPLPVYDSTEIQQAHAIVVRARVDLDAISAA